ncbi:MAG: RNA pyrophosphohydrolase [Holosporales bacterium]|jgi:putative (di)nucleoside polyphosphate hydrolase|nr:RNA pyrophosphohydrolase [Holosporales bacterium]
MVKDREGNFRNGVGMVVVNNDNRIFAGKKNSVNTKMVSFFLKKPWQMPQGGIEKGEAPIEAALRELKEEIGTDNVDVIAETEEWLEYLVPHGLRRKNNKFIGQRQKWFLLKFLGNDKEIDLKLTNHSEFDIWRWMSVGNVIRLSVHFKRNLYLDVFKSFRWYFDGEERK